MILDEKLFQLFDRDIMNIMKQMAKLKFTFAYYLRNVRKERLLI